MADLLSKGLEIKAKVAKRLSGRNQVIFRKAQLKCKVTSADVLNAVFIAARMQAEIYIDKLAHGDSLDPSEVRGLRDLAEITKLELVQPNTMKNVIDTPEVEEARQSLYQALSAAAENT